jgi:hypothetical protein
MREVLHWMTEMIVKMRSAFSEMALVLLAFFIFRNLFVASSCWMLVCIYRPCMLDRVESQLHSETTTEECM